VLTEPRHFRIAVTTLSVVSAALVASLGACFDLFHSTSDLLTACEIDAQACAADGGIEDATRSDAGGTDFCMWKSSLALEHARHACAWLGACETPMGGNAFGPCMFQALLAYDCEANPNHRVKGRAHELWDCLRSVTSCSEVDACVFPNGPQKCGSAGEYTACSAAGGAMATNAAVRIACLDGGAQADANARGENCALWGQTCATAGGRSLCSGGSGLSCTKSGCFGAPRTELQWCVDGSDIGIDCASQGAQRCEAFPSALDAQWPACMAESDSGACVPDASATCMNGVASSCPSGVRETVDCNKILQSKAGCVAGPLAPPFDWTASCAVMPAQCLRDSCTDGGLIGCARGAAFSVDCGDAGLGPCQKVLTDNGSLEHVACAPPVR
jgi:hypothetical protein